jgi:hypothetical protein
MFKELFINKNLTTSVELELLGDKSAKVDLDLVMDFFRCTSMLTLNYSFKYMFSPMNKYEVKKKDMPVIPLNSNFMDKIMTSGKFKYRVKIDGEKMFVLVNRYMAQVVTPDANMDPVLDLHYNKNYFKDRLLNTHDTNEEIKYVFVTELMQTSTLWYLYSIFPAVVHEPDRDQLMILDMLNIKVMTKYNFKEMDMDMKKFLTSIPFEDFRMDGFLVQFNNVAYCLKQNYTLDMLYFQGRVLCHELVHGGDHELELERYQGLGHEQDHAR